MLFSCLTVHLFVFIPVIGSSCLICQPLLFVLFNMSFHALLSNKFCSVFLIDLFFLTLRSFIQAFSSCFLLGLSSLTCHLFSYFLLGISWDILKDKQIELFYEPFTKTQVMLLQTSLKSPAVVRASLEAGFLGVPIRVCSNNQHLSRKRKTDPIFPACSILREGNRRESHGSP